MRTFSCLVVIVFTCISTLAGAQTPLKPSSIPSGVAATLYADGDLVSIHEIAAEGPWLYVAAHDLDGAQYIDVWRVAFPAAPERVDTLTYPDLQTDAFVFTPLAIIPRNGVVLIQADGALRSYRQGADGKLTFIEEIGIGTGLEVASMRQLSAGGAFASHEQQVVPNGEIGEVSLDEIHQQVIISLRDPAHPFLIRASGADSNGAYLNTDEPVNAVIDGKPASIYFDSETGELVLTSFDRTVQSHLDTFWSSKLDAIFAEGALDLSLQEHVRAALLTLDLPAMRGELLARYATALDIDGVTIEALIRGQHLGTDALDAVLSVHGLSLDESLALSLRKLAVKGLDENLRAELGRLVFQPALEAWLDETLGVAWEGLSSAQVAAEIALAFDAEIDAEGAVRYLTLNLIAPLLDDPEFMIWTLEDLIDALVNSDVGAVIDTTLTVTGVGLIAEVLGIIDDLPGIDLPNCAVFPANARGLIELALYSGGADLDAEGLAWFEMLKFYQYLTGGVDYVQYVEDVELALKDLHLDLAEDFTDKYLGFFAGVEGFDLSQDALADIAEHASIDQALGDLLVHAALARLETAGFETNVTLREFLQDLGVSFNALDEITGDVDGLVAALSVDGLHLETAGNLFDLAETAPLSLGGYIEAYVIAHLEALFGIAIPDLSLRAALALYLTEQFDLSGSMGAHLEGLLDNFVLEVHAEALFGAYLTTVLNAFEGDCIAQWLLGLDIATGVATPLFLEAYPLAAEAALSAAYHAGVEAAISMMFSLVADVVVGDLSGHWASWTEQVTSTTRRFPVPGTEDGYDITLNGAFTWEDRVVQVLSYRSQSQPFDPRPVTLETFLPDAPEASRIEIDLGQWEQVDYVEQAGKDLFISGTHRLNGELSFGLLVDLERLAGRYFTGGDYVPLGVTQQMAALDGGAMLALRGVDRVTLIPNASARTPWQIAHAGDTDNDGLISLSELLRVIQFYNSGGYHCGVETEDGFEPGLNAGAQACTPHASDYNAQDWTINLSELLRFIQLYNSGGYTSCLEGEDAFCPV